jgi:hypothetical protein
LTERQQLRRFGLVMTITFATIGAVLLARSLDSGLVALAVAATFAACALLIPLALRRVERAWMAFARVLGTINTVVILTVAYVLIVTPIAIIRRALAADPLGLRFDRHRPSYWVATEPDGPGTRPDKPF